MCGKAMYKHQVTDPGSHMNFLGPENKIYSGVWGFKDGDSTFVYDARAESLRGYWRKYFKDQRGVIELDGFYEKGMFFCAKESILMPVIYNSHYDFLIITKPARKPVIEFHTRQPMIIEPSGVDKWIKESIFQPARSELLMVSKAS